MEQKRRNLAASGGQGVAMTLPGILVTIGLWQLWPEKMAEFGPFEQNGIFAGIVAGFGYVVAVVKTWAADVLLTHPNNLLLRLLAGGRGN